MPQQTSAPTQREDEHPAVMQAGCDAAVPDAALVAAAQTDTRAFDALYDRYVDPVFRYCFRRLGNREAAEDATSAVFARALSALPRYREEHFRGWLFAIAHNVVVNEARRRRPDCSLDAARAAADPDANPEHAALVSEERRRLRDLLHALPGDQREVVELRLAGLKGEEIARALGRSRGAIKSAQFRALRNLRRMVAERGEGEEADDDRPA